MRVDRHDLPVLWMTLGCALVAGSICAGIPLGLNVDSSGSMILISIIFFLVFALGAYICIASFGVLPLPEPGRRQREKEERLAREEQERERLEAERIAREKREQEEREKAEKEKREKEQAAGMLKSIRDTALLEENDPEDKDVDE
jgi:hypothetical protein